MIASSIRILKWSDPGLQPQFCCLLYSYGSTAYQRTSSQRSHSHSSHEYSKLGLETRNRSFVRRTYAKYQASASSSVLSGSISSWLLPCQVISSKLVAVFCCNELASKASVSSSRRRFWTLALIFGTTSPLCLVRRPLILWACPRTLSLSLTWPFETMRADKHHWVNLLK